MNRIRRLLAVRLLQERRAKLSFDRLGREFRRCEAARDTCDAVRRRVGDRAAKLEHFFNDAAKTGVPADVVQHCLQWRRFLKELGLYWDTKRIDAEFDLRDAQEALEMARRNYLAARAARERVEHLLQRLVLEARAQAEARDEDEADLQGIVAADRKRRAAQDVGRVTLSHA